MTTKSKTKARTAGPAAAAGLNLNDLLITLKSHTDLSETRLRDLRSSIKRVALLVGNDPAGIPFDLPAISAKLALVNPVAAGLTAKSFSNIRSNFITAVKASGLKSINRSAGTPLSPEWRRLMRKLSGRRAHLGLSRLARFASAKGIEPAQVDDAVIEAFITAVRSGTLHRKPNELHRKVAQIWNEAVERSGLDLQAVRVPSFQSPPSGSIGPSLAERSAKTLTAFSPGARGPTSSRPMPVPARWRRGPSSCAGIRSTPPSPLWSRAASRCRPSNLSPLDLHHNRQPLRRSRDAGKFQTHPPAPPRNGRGSRKHLQP